MKTIENTKTLTLSGKYFEGIGRRKRAIARVRICNGVGKYYINNKEILDNIVQFNQPLVIVGKDKEFDVYINISGGGIIGQRDAIIHGIARALVKSDETLKSTLRKVGFVTRDPREKERKKPGLKRARRAPQWQKR